MRKIVQIAATGDEVKALYALCDDGSVWMLPMRGEVRSINLDLVAWDRLPQLPDDQQRPDSAEREIARAKDHLPVSEGQ